MVMNFTQDIFSQKYLSRLKQLKSRTNNDESRKLDWLESIITDNASLQTINESLDLVKKTNIEYLKELISRLRQVSMDEFLPIISEILVIKLISEKCFKICELQCELGGNVLDFSINENENLFYCEVKSFIDIPPDQTESTYYGPIKISFFSEPNRSKKIRDAIKRSENQFDKDKFNILFLVDWKVSSIDKVDIEDALFGAEKFNVEYDLKTTDIISVNSFRESKKAQFRNNQGTRIGAIVVIKGTLYPLDCSIKFIYHNPYAKKPIGENLFKNFTQIHIS